MDRQRLEEFTFSQLQAEAVRYGFYPAGDRDSCIDMIMSHIERNGPLVDLLGDKTDTHPSVALMPDSVRVSTITQANSSVGSNSQPASTKNPLFQMCSLMLKQSRQQQAMMQQLIAAMNINNKNNADGSVPVANTSTHTARVGAIPSNQDLSTYNSQSAVSTAHAVNLLFTHILDFYGTEEEDFEAWVQTVERVA